MNIDKITMTGADNSIDPVTLLSYSVEYPAVEWGILLSRNSAGKPRFPNIAWMDLLASFALVHKQQHSTVLNFSGHLCGSFMREFLLGLDGFVTEIGPLWNHLQRIQINTHGQLERWDKSGLSAMLQKYSDKQFIFQYDDVNKKAFEYAATHHKNVAALFDLSHGTGVLPETWPDPIVIDVPGGNSHGRQIPVYCGYAGGLSPSNIAAQLVKLETQLPAKHKLWIDMETHIRSDNDTKFDLNKVHTVLEVCKIHHFVVNS